MRIVGKQTPPFVGPRGPTKAEVRASMDLARMTPRVIPVGVYRYRNHCEANQQMDQWIVDGMVERASALDAQRALEKHSANVKRET
jgi:hypothetical protein